MSYVDTDIDIDFADRDKALIGLDHVPAMLTTQFGQKQRHPSGVYFQAVPFDPISGLCAFDYKQAAHHGYFKIDFLNNSIYESVRDEAHLEELMAREPDWSLLEFEDVVERLAHVHSHHEIIRQIRPASIEDLAVVLALIRPGKARLRGLSRPQIDAEIWEAEPDGYRFKRAHAIAYATSIAVQMNLIFDELSAAIDAAKDPL